MAADDRQPYLGYFNKLIDEHDNTDHCSLGKKNFSY